MRKIAKGDAKVPRSEAGKGKKGEEENGQPEGEASSDSGVAEKREQPNKDHPISCGKEGTPTGETSERLLTRVGPEGEAQSFTKVGVGNGPSSQEVLMKALWDYD